jgi:imidazolonepropionase-like amidohydrolase
MSAIVSQDREFHELEVAAADPVSGDLSRQHIGYQVRPVLAALPDVAPRETRYGVCVRGDGEPVARSGRMSAEQIPPPGLKIVEVAENRLVARPDAIRKSVGSPRPVEPDVDGRLRIRVRCSHRHRPYRVHARIAPAADSPCQVGRAAIDQGYRGLVAGQPTWQSSRMPVLRVRGVALPGGDPVDLYADGDQWTTDSVAHADLVAEGWLLPGLVDAHTHPGAETPGKPPEESVLRDDLREHVAAGVTMIRAPGLAADPPDWFGRDEELPRAVHAGPWIAQHGQFFDGWGQRADHAELPRVAAEQAARTGWAKVIADWQPDDAVLPVEVLRQIVAAVHAVGGRLAVHSQHAAGGYAAVQAGVDSLEHGMCLDPALLSQMADQGTALTPTLSVITSSLARVRERPDGPLKDWYLTGATAHGKLAAAAAEAGVTVLAGTDSRPCGRVIDEVRALAEAGVPVQQAIGAASWSARGYLGLAGLTEGAPADVVVYDADPRGDLGQLAMPRAVVLRGKVRLRRS